MPAGTPYTNRFIHDVSALHDAYDASLGHIASHLRKTAQTLALQDITTQADSALEAINLTALHVGQNTDKANQPLLNFIDNGFFESDGKANLEKLKNFTFPTHSLDTITATKTHAQGIEITNDPHTISPCRTPHMPKPPKTLVIQRMQ